MAGPIQKALSEVVTTGAAIAGIGKKLSDDERQAQEKKQKEEAAAASAAAKEAAIAEAEAEKGRREEEAKDKEAKSAAMEADLIRMGADPERARAFMTARELGLPTTSFGMMRKKGKFVGSYSTVAERLAADYYTDSLSSRVINDRGFRDRVAALKGNKAKRLLEATGGK